MVKDVSQVIDSAYARVDKVSGVGAGLFSGLTVSRMFIVLRFAMTSLPREALLSAGQ